MHHEALFYIFGRGVYLYGICFALGIIGCFVFLILTMKYQRFSETSSDAVLLIGIVAVGVGVLFGFLFQGFYDYIETGEFTWGSMTFIGGLIGGVLSFLGIWNLYMYVVRPRTKLKWLKGEMNATLTDALPFIPIGIAIAHAFGRLGCFFGGCCYGIEADWGLPCAHGYSKALKMTMDGVNVIPTQLFEMAFLVLLAGTMAFLYFRYKFYYNFSVYAIGYGIFRFIIEFFRADDRGELIGAVTPSQFWGIIMVIVGIAYIFAQYYLFSKLMKHPEREREAARLAAANGAPAVGEAPAETEGEKERQAPTENNENK